MPIHPAMSSRFPLLEGVPSMQALMEDPRYAQVRDEFGAHPGLPGARRARPVRRRARPARPGAGPGLRRRRRPAQAQSGTRPCLVWMHGGAFMAGSLDMPEADWTSRELARRAGAVVVSVDYRLCNDGVHYPVPHDDVVAAVRWAGEERVLAGHRPGTGQCRRGERGGEPRRRRGAQAPRRRRAAARGADLRLRRGALRHPAGVRRARRANARGAGACCSSRRTATSFFNVNYLGGPVSKADGYAFPALADLRGLCPTLVLNAEYDDLRASGQAFAAALAAAGVDVRQVMATSMLHGFLNLPATIGPVSAALDLIAATLHEPAALPAAVITA